MIEYLKEVVVQKSKEITKEELKILEESLDNFAINCFGEFGYDTCSKREKLICVWMLFEDVLRAEENKSDK
jgi:predicted metal-dependent TIM-barrel fold hydrolase